MIDEKFINQVIINLYSKGYECFTSEAQLRDLFAIEIGMMNPKIMIMPEYTQNTPLGWRCSERLVHFDLLIEDKENNEKILIEFKYKTSKGEFITKNGMYVKLSDNSDSTNGRYAVWRDIYRIETFSNLKHIDKGFVIFITNNKSYYADPKKGTLAEEFSISPKLHVAANKNWNITNQSNKSISVEYRNDEKPLIISNDYRFIYHQYSMINDTNGKNHMFYVLVVPVYSSDYHDKLVRQINSIGKKNFVKYYDLLKTGISSQIKSVLINDNLKKTSVDTIVSKANNVFNNNKNIEALRIIIDSNNVELSIRKQAEDLLEKELNSNDNVLSPNNKIETVNMVMQGIKFGKDFNCEHVKYADDVKDEEMIPGLCSYLEEMYESVVEFYEMLSNTVKDYFELEDFKRIPIILSKEKPIDVYKNSDVQIAQMLKNRIETRGNSITIKEMQEILLRQKIILNRVGAYFTWSLCLDEYEAPYIKIYYLNFECSDINDYYAKCAQCLAHEFFHYIHDCIAPQTFNQIKSNFVNKAVKEALADFFSVLFLLYRNSKIFVKLAENRYNWWKDNFGSSLPYAEAYWFYYVDIGWHIFCDDFNKYISYNQMMRKFGEVLNTSRFDFQKAYLRLKE